jgi:tRNA threonylcarbamoyladenosine biosynthesis protein TsaB
MALLLSLEASADLCSAALHENGQLISIERIHQPRAAAAQLAPAIKKLFDAENISRADLKGVAIASGPGSYTGLRIVSSTAKGICSALNVPLVAVDTLQVLAAAVVPDDAISFYCPALDARRDEIYFQLLDRSRRLLIPTTNHVVVKDSFRDYLEQGAVLFFGNGAAKTVKILEHPNARLLEGVEPDADHVGLLAFEKWKAGQFESLELFEPHYLKEFLIGRKPAIS